MKRPAKTSAHRSRGGRTPVASSSAPATGTATQPSKGDLRATIEGHEARIKQLLAQAERRRKTLEVARNEITELKAEVEENELQSSQETEQFEKTLAQLHKDIETEKTGRLKALARVHELEQRQYQARAKLDQGAESQIEKLKVAVKHYKAEVTWLQSELARYSSQQNEPT